MFRRTLLVFLTFVFLCLFLTVGYAVLGLSGPATTLDGAERAFAARDYAACVRLCDLAESSLGPSAEPQIRRRILDLRHRAHIAVENLVPALADLERLRVLAPEDPELAIRQIRWTVTAGFTQKALRLAEAFLADNPDDPQALELTGEAWQASYQELAGKFRIELGTRFDEETGNAAFAALQSWLYRSDDDPEAAVGLEKFESILRLSQPRVYAAGAYHATMHEIRRQIRHSQSAFRASLARGGRPVGAYAGLAYALDQGGRRDDLQILAGIYLQRFDHLFTVDAAIDLCRVHEAAGNHRAVIATAERFLPRGAWRERVADQRIDDGVRRLLLLEARALHTIGDRERLTGLADECTAMQESELLDVRPELHLIRAFVADLANQHTELNKELDKYSSIVAKLPLSPELVRDRREATALRIAMGARSNYNRIFFEWQYGVWRELDRRAIEPIAGLVRFLLDHGEPAAALLHARDGWRTVGHDEDYLRLYARVVDANQKLSDRGTDALLRECLELGELLPQDAEDVLLLPLAERALERGHPDIALACAQRGSRVFNWAIWPRVLQAEAAFALDDPLRAKRAVESLLSHHPTSPEGMRLMMRAREALGEATDDLAYDLLNAGQRDARVATTLLQRAASRNDGELSAQLAETIQRDHADDPRALLLVADVQHARGEYERAKRTLHDAGRLALERDDKTFSPAFRRYFLTTVEFGDDPVELRVLFEQVLTQNQHDTHALYELADGLRQIGRPDLGYHMILPVVGDDEHAEARSGKHFALAGELALATGRREAAERHLLQAMTFADGLAASRALTLLWLREGRDAVAADSYWETIVDDLTSACLTARLGRIEPGNAWAVRVLRSAPFDVPAAAFRALFAPDPTTPAELAALVEKSRPLLLDVLTFLDEPPFAADAVARAALLADANPQNRHARWLHARALANAGQAPAALGVLGTLIRAATPDDPFVAAHDEVVRLFDRDPALIPEHAALLPQLVDAELIRRGVATPRMLALVSRHYAALEVSQNLDKLKSLESLARVWIDYPESAGVGLDQVDLVAALGTLDLALELCTAVEPYVPATQRNRFLGTWFSLATTSLAARPDHRLLERAVAKAEQVRGAEGAYGVVVHFLIDRDIEQHGEPGADDETRRARILQLLDEHLGMLARGADTNTALLPRTLDRLEPLAGRAGAIRRAETLLRADPSLIDVWVRLAHWLIEDGHPDRALASLRWVYAYLPRHPAVAECIALAARSGKVRDVDRVAADGLTPAVLDTPIGRLARGLLALRDARPADALPDLELAPESATTIYFRAMAHVELGDREAARALFVRLASEHASDPISANAAHFAEQLAH